MSQVPYPYNHPYSERYVFISVGRLRIEKAVDFIPIGIKNIVNMGFGDRLPDGSIDDTANSNNGDLVKVLATVISILKDYTTQYPKVVIFFAGSSIQRTRMYSRILRTYYVNFSREFSISGIVGSEDQNRRIAFDPKLEIEYLAFLVERIN